MKRCHSYHMQVYPNKVKVTLTFSDQEMYLVQYLSAKYSQGCLADFSHDVVMRGLQDHFMDDIRGIHSLKAPNATSARSTDTEGTSSPEE
jgi:ABC-type transport system involved in cytochrome bd biosynthesis fused ATPase/permease subunit